MCTKCGVSKDIDSFHKSPKGLFYRQPKCKECMSAYYKANREKALARQKISTSLRKEEVKEYQKKYREDNAEYLALQHKEYYQKNSEKIKANVKRWRSENIARDKEYHKRYHIEHRIEILARVKRWALNNRERYIASMKAAHHRRRERIIANGNNTLTAEEIRELFQRMPYCAYCRAVEKLSLDHVVPVAKGGQNCLENVTVACMPCNASKGVMSLEEFIAAHDLMLAAF